MSKISRETRTRQPSRLLSLLELQHTMAFSTQLSARTLGKGMLAATVLTLLVSTAQAHEHHEDKIPEGEAISPDPLVRSFE